MVKIRIREINQEFTKPNKHSIEQTDAKIEFRKKQKRSKVLMLGLHSEYSNYRDNFAEGTLKFVRIIEVLELQRFE